MNRNFRIQTADQPNSSVLTLRGRGVAMGIGGAGSRGQHPELASGTEDVRIRKKYVGPDFSA